MKHRLQAITAGPRGIDTGANWQNLPAAALLHALDPHVTLRQPAVVDRLSAALLFFDLALFGDPSRLPIISASE